MTIGPESESLNDGDPCVAEFLARHGIANQQGTDTDMLGDAAAPAPAAPTPSPTDTLVFEGPADQSIEQKLGLATSGVQVAAQTYVNPQAATGTPATAPINPVPVQPAAAATPQAPPAAAAPAAAAPAPTAPQKPPRPTQLPARRKGAEQKSADAMRQLRSVANSISVSISRSNQVKEKLHEAARFLAIAMIASLAALGLAYFTSTARSFIFFAAMMTLVLGLLCAYRTTMIMTRLRRVAKL